MNFGHSFFPGLKEFNLVCAIAFLLDMQHGIKTKGPQVCHCAIELRGLENRKVGIPRRPAAKLIQLSTKFSSSIDHCRDFVDHSRSKTLQTHLERATPRCFSNRRSALCNATFRVLHGPE